jgi:hypothetical protein
MAFSVSSLPMVLYLLAGTCANLPFLIRSFRDIRKGSPLSVAMPSAPPMLMTTSFAELCWVLPCLIQCGIQLFSGTGAWSVTEKVGCDVMGTYSVFASISGMVSTMLVALFTLKELQGKSVSARTSTIAGVAVLAFSLLFSLLPYMGVGEYKNTNEGFCYIDWHDTGLATIMLIVTLPTVTATVAMLGLAVRRGGWPSTADLGIMAVAFLSAWIGWIPACFIGLAGADFPKCAQAALPARSRAEPSGLFCSCPPLGQPPRC